MIHPITSKNEQELINTQFFSVVYEGKSMKFCAQAPKTCIHKRYVLDFHLFA